MIRFVRKRDRANKILYLGITSRSECSYPSPKELSWAISIGLRPPLIKFRFSREQGDFRCVFCNRVIGKRKGYFIDDPIDQFVGTSWEQHIGGWVHFSCKASKEARQQLRKEIKEKDLDD